MVKNKDLQKEAALVALQSLIATSVAEPEDLVNDALNIGNLFSRKFMEMYNEETAEVADTAPIFIPEANQKFYYPKKSRAGYIVENEIWNHTRSQLALQDLQLCYNDEMECIEHCKKLNTAYTV